MKLRLFDSIYGSSHLMRDIEPTSELGVELCVNTLSVYNEEYDIFDDSGYEFLDLINYNSTEPFKYHSFNYSIKDAIEKVKLGLADRVVILKIDKSSVISVRKYENRNYGEKVRQKFLKVLSSKKYQFKYSVAMIVQDRITLSRVKRNLTDKNQFQVYCGADFNFPNFQYFNTEDEAKSKICALEQSADKINEEFQKLLEERSIKYENNEIPEGEIRKRECDEIRQIINNNLSYTDAEKDVYRGRYCWPDPFDFHIFVEQVLICEE